jgi:hypothetical protein
MIRLPHSIHAIGSVRGWREHLCWPIGPDARCAIAEGVVATLRAWRRSLPAGPATDTADLASLHLLTSGARAALYAHEIAGAAATGAELVGNRPEFSVLRDGEAPGETTREPYEARQASRIPFARELRAIKNARRWTPLRRLAQAVLAPEAHVLSTGGLLLESTAGHSLSYAAPDELVAAARRTLPAPRLDTAELAEGWAAALSESEFVPSALRASAADLLRAQAVSALSRADRDLAGLARLTDMPGAVWAGGAGSYATRAIGLEVMRRGGSVRRFAHGGALALDGYADTHALVDMAATSRFTLATSRQLDLLRDVRIEASFDRWLPEFDAAAGDPKFRAVPRAGRVRPARRPTVLYVGTAFAGQLVHIPPVPPDAVYFDWQCRLLDSLNALDADVYCKPHPENLVLSGIQPLPTLYSALDVPFSKALAQADVVVFDYCLSTSFWEALCSDRPVVLLDVANSRWHPAVDAMLSRRCTRLAVAYDAGNLPHFDAAALADAVATARAGDPAEFRDLLAGDG